MKHKPTLIAILAGSLALAGATATYAATNTNTTTHSMDHLVTAISEKFHLNTSDVQAVFDAERAEMETQHQADAAQQLTQAVTDGTITQDQADLITAKRAELEGNRPDPATLSTLSETERHDQMEQHMTDLKQWATDNNIPVEYVLPGHPGMDKPGMHMMRGR